MRPGRLFGKIASLIFIVISTTVNAQNVTIAEVNAPLDSAFKKIRDETGYRFVYTDGLLKKANMVTATFNNVPLTDALAQLFLKQPLDYTIYNKMVILKDKDTNSGIQETYTINGTVIDKNGNPVPGAIVFITNSKHMTSTDGAGKFNLGNISPGIYELVIKMLGFDTFIQQVDLHKGPTVMTARLTESVTTLNAVTINAKKHKLTAIDKTNYMALFLKTFIGNTVNAERCKLVNPKVLQFDVDEKNKTLKVTANDFLILENKALGYQIKYLLTEFIFDWSRNYCSMGGYPYFEEMKGTEAQQRRWNNNRRLTYLSSDRHFFKALVNNSLKQEGFQVYMLTDLIVNYSSLKFKEYTIRENNDPKKLRTAIPLADSTSLFITGHGNFKIITSTPKIVGRNIIRSRDTIRGQDTIGLKGLYIVYTGAKEAVLYYKTGSPLGLFPFINEKLSKQQKLNRQISIIKPIADTITVNKNGSLMPIKSFTYSGYWAWQRMADIMPLDYTVDPLPEIKK